MSTLAHMFRLCLALMLALTLSHTTVVRGEGGTIAGWIALCAGDEVVSVAVDGDGAPVVAHAPCPDCVMPGVALLVTVPSVAPPMQLAGRISRDAAGPGLRSFAVISPAARGPPAFV